jgi:hypothetical protein
MMAMSLDTEFLSRWSQTKLRWLAAIMEAGSAPADATLQSAP